jgi:hypothetical protein
VVALFLRKESHAQIACETHGKSPVSFWDVFAQLDRIETTLNVILGEIKAMANELDALTATVTRTADVEDSAIVLLQGLKTALDAAIASGNPAALTALSTSLGAKTDALAAAVVANTPAATP